MKTRNLILTACFGTVICIGILCSDIANAQPPRKTQGENNQSLHKTKRNKSELQKSDKNAKTDYAKEIEAAYKRGFKDGKAASNKGKQKIKQDGKQKFNRNKKYAKKYNQKKNFRNDHKQIPKERLHAAHKPTTKVNQNWAKKDLQKTGLRHFVQKRFQHAKFDGKFNRKQFGYGQFNRGQFGYIARRYFHKPEFKPEFKPNFRPDFRPNFRSKARPEFKSNFGAQRGELAKKHEHDKTKFTPPDKLKSDRNKKDKNKNNNNQKRSKDRA
ncbi:MAG: hypothetical protein LBP59_02880 [Planctomycetaceae bacterium]|jgi:hypothetical protein|nr:hypothetical protein [Planctomycetaceae bacterium]